MPIDHRHRFVFIHIPKTAGISVMLALQRTKVKLEFNRRNIFPRLLEHPRRVEILRRLRTSSTLGLMTNYVEQHLPASILREFVPDELWTRYYKFGFVRNPWDLCVSSFAYMKRTFETSPEAVARDPDIAYLMTHCDFEEYLRMLPLFSSRGGDMTSYLVDDDERLLVDFVGRFERLEEDFAEICSHLKVSPTLTHENKGERAAYRDYYSDVTKGLVAAYYARDIERFDYAF
jgi:hypothetical protein